ncbi:hypothetical protein [Halopelagius longus]|uniref:STAS/SEC14 domain-containing protein n=1 Tax=Halopelagius longus TaxID=1236180 RepID=A0A1H1EQG4_9EURY|nr:hypothetical protein [Halopelagius longus]RDI71849.1 hypothetical protein DWB78_09000 [Halopelagius longus]SDQ90982.1 hypothetical protein SAMN05216278_3017 [Halopelagius longus]
MAADIYRYEIDAGVAVFDLTEFSVNGGLLLQEFFEAFEAAIARSDVTAAVLVFAEDGGLSTWFFERFDDLLTRIDEYELDGVAVVAPPVKRNALRGRLAETDVTVKTPETASAAVEWARTSV